MPATVIVNFLTVVHKDSGGIATAFPDVCKTPSPAGPIPIPYPNIAMSSDTDKGSKKVKMDGNSIMLKDSNFKTSTGDEAGSAGGGVVSSKTKGKAEFMLYSFDVKVEGKNVPRLSDIMVQNCGSPPNTPPMPEVQAPQVVILTGVKPDPEEEEEIEEYSITIGVHLDGPDDWIGHAFISLEYPKGTIKTKGFWPKNGFDLGEKPDRKGVIFGMAGAILDDSDYLHKKSGMNAKKAFKINEARTKSGNDVIDQYIKDKPKYILLTNQCAIFALKVLKAGGKNIRGTGIPARPTKLYKALTGSKK